MSDPCRKWLCWHYPWRLLAGWLFGQEGISLGAATPHVLAAALCATDYRRVMGADHE
jgi:hypothetical protein